VVEIEEKAEFLGFLFSSKCFGFTPILFSKILDLDG
jgi:hypothetical protein